MRPKAWLRRICDGEPMPGLFDQRLTQHLPRLAPAEQRLARQVAGRKDRAILGTAQQIADWAGTSDATVLRMVRGLGYDTLARLREDLLADLDCGLAGQPHGPDPPRPRPRRARVSHARSPMSWPSKRTRC